jgi:hypothetical protein
MRMQARQVIVGGSIAVGSIALFFVWAIYFGLFGTKIDFAARPVATAGFFLWMVTGSFGAGMMLGGGRFGFKVMLAALVALSGAFFIGWLQGNYS